MNLNNEVISISSSCNDRVCNVRHLIFDSKSRCVGKILNNEKLDDCKRTQYPDQHCSVKYIDTGLIVTSASALIVYHSKSTISLNFETRKVSGQGSVVCNLSPQSTKTFRFDSKIIRSDSFITLPMIEPMQLKIINSLTLL